MDRKITPRLVALDIDGTLLAPGVHHTAVPEQAITEAIANLIDAGVIVLLASGRMFPGTLHIAQHVGITEPLICQQGASIHNLDGSLQHRFSIDPEIAQEIAKLAVDEGWSYAWFDAHRYLVSAPSSATQHFADVSHVNIEQHSDPKNSGLTATGVDIISTAEHSHDIFKRLRARFGKEIELLDFPSVTAAHSHQANKGLALALITSKLGITSAEVVAIGDSLNDVSMLRWAGLGATPAHCDKHARTAADEVLTGAGVDGVANLLRELADNR